ncbi:MAG: molybdopterin-dependent oxidoreductase [Acidimicrobiia bacterium]|nr:molybdopterin-dependent oxidoreductase [Acidimicrobiia bacterium]
MPVDFEPPSESADPETPTVIRVNGELHRITSPGATPLVYVLRNELGLKGTRFGCGEGTCGTCTVLIDGVARYSCDLPIEYVGDSAISTVEDLADGSAMSALQQAFIAEQAAQCGFCTSGILLQAQGLLDRIPHPTDNEIREALDPNLCRCGSHARVIRAVRNVADGIGTEREPGIGSPSTASMDVLNSAGMGNDYLTVGPDGTVLLTIGKADLGQGISTTLAQIAADALQVATARIRIIAPDTAISPDEGTTASSMSTEQGGANIRQAAADLRTHLLDLAAERLGATAAELHASDGVITAPDNRSVSYWELADGTTGWQDSTGPGAGEAAVGTSIPRWDLPRKLRGEPSFVHDLELPGMLHGRILRPPTRNARLASVDEERAAGAPGVVRIVRSGEFLGVIAQEEHQAVAATNLLSDDAVWDPQPTTIDLADPRHLLLQDVQTETAHSITADGPSEPQRSFSATYTRPFLVHGSIGPSCAVALDDHDTLTVWSHTQGVFPLRKEVAQALDLPETAVRVVHMEGAGCYGHNGADDCAFDAAVLAREVPGKPVRVQWSRADEFLWEPHGSAMTVQLESSLDSEGNIVRWNSDVWSYVHTARPQSPRSEFLAETHMDQPSRRQTGEPLHTESTVRNALPLYAIPNVEVRGHVAPDDDVRTSALRSLGAHANVFAVESLIDEMAAELGESPVSFRLRHLADPRARDVVSRVAELSGAPIGGTDENGNGFGLGFARYKNQSGYGAVVAQIEAVTEVRLVHLWAVVDAGTIVNPDGATNQIEGGLIQSASWALMERVGFQDGSPTPRTWEDYPILRFSEIPEITVELINRHDERSVGVGEVVQGPTTAAIGNALRAILGKPIRDLPFTRDRIIKALLE